MFTTIQYRIERVCVSERPVFQIDRFPIRVDEESAGVDVVWREPRQTSTPHEHSILRRERFQFDNIYAGNGSIKKLSSIVKDRVHRAVTGNRSFVFLCLSCGETALDCASSLEPPLNILYGNKGGSGVISTAVSTIMSVLQPKSTPLSKKPTPSISSATITMTAVVILANNKDKVVDLLCDSRGYCQLSRRPDGKYSISNATVVQLENISDAERIIGVLLGRKSCRKDMQALQCELTTADESFAPYEHLEATEATMLITIHVSPVAVGKLSPMDFHFLCPYGDLWYTPGLDICLLSESLSSYPRTPSPSILRSSVLSQLTMNPLSPADFLLTVNISSSKDADTTSVGAKSLTPKFSSAASLKSFRITKSRPLLSSASVSVTDEDRVDLVQNALQVLRVLSQIPSTASF